MSTKTLSADKVELEHKAAPTVSPVSGLIEADDATGVVEAIVSVTGLLDEDHDVIKPGAYTKTLAKRRPKGIFHHDWHKWVARTEAVEELMPGDDRLPKKTKDGKPWPAQAGGLYVKARFNLNTREGKDAYENVKFFSESGECEWSVGYKVPAGKSVRTKSGERHIEEMDLFEFSPVLFGAAPLSGTLSVKSAAVLEGSDTDTEEDGEESEEDAQGVSLEDLEDLEAAADLVTDDLASFEEEEAEGKAATINTGPVKNDAQVPPGQDVRDFDSGKRSGTNLIGNARSFINASDQEVRVLLKDNGFYEVHVDNQIQLSPNDRSDLTADEVEGVLAKYVATDLLLPVNPKVGDMVAFRGSNGRVERVDSSERGPRSATVKFFGSEARTVPVEYLSRPKKAGKSAEDELEEKMAHESLDRSPKKNWVEKAGQLPAYIQHIAKDISEEQGVPLERAIPMAISAVKRWAAGGENVTPETRAKAAAAVAEWEKLKARSHSKGLWSERLHPREGDGRFSGSGGVGPTVGQFLDHINKPAPSNKPTLATIKVGDKVEYRGNSATIKRVIPEDEPAGWSDIDDPENPAPIHVTGGAVEFRNGQIAPIRALSWPKGKKSADEEVLESEHFPYLPGTYEELRERIREGAAKALNALSADVSHVEVMGTWPGQAVVTAYHSDGTAKSYEMGYNITIDGDEPEEISLDEPVPVELKVSVDGQEEDGSGLLPYPSVINDVTLDLKAILGLTEAKAGRVLSGVNERRLLAAVENLVAVLKAAGLEVDAGAREKQEEEEREQAAEAAPYRDSTAPSAVADTFGKALLNPALLARGYRVLGEALADED